MTRNIPHYDINTLVSKMIVGDISKEEGQALLRMAEANPDLKNKIEMLMDEEDFVSRYQLYRSIEAEKAKERFKESLASEALACEDGKQATFVWLRRIVAIAAVVAIVFIGGWMLMDRKVSVTPVVVSPELSHAIERVQQNAMNGATLTINGKTVKVKDAKNVQTETEQMEGNNSLFGSDDITESSLVTRRDKEFWMVLDDGTYVHLNYNTTLIYPNHFVGNERKVKLKGEAYFIIAKDSKKRPFIVETANGDVHDYGTEFNVNTVRTAGVTNVVLVKGKVGVSSKHGKEYLLQPGELAALQPGKAPSINKVDVNLYTSWNTGNFYFDGCTLADLMEVIGSWYNMKVEFTSEDIQELRFTGSIDKYEPMGPTLNAIESITGLKISVKKTVITISKN